MDFPVVLTRNEAVDFPIMSMRKIAEDFLVHKKRCCGYSCPYMGHESVDFLVYGNEAVDFHVQYKRNKAVFPYGVFAK